MRKHPHHLLNAPDFEEQNHIAERTMVKRLNFRTFANILNFVATQADLFVESMHVSLGVFKRDPPRMSDVSLHLWKAQLPEKQCNVQSSGTPKTPCEKSVTS